MYNKNSETAIAKKDYAFSMAFASLDFRTQKELKAKIMKALGIKDQTFRLKRIGAIGFTLEQADVIRDIFKQYNIDKVFNYEYINK